MGRDTEGQAWQQGKVREQGSPWEDWASVPTGFWAALGAPGTALQARPERRWWERAQTRSWSSPVLKEERLRLRCGLSVHYQDDRKELL